MTTGSTVERAEAISWPVWRLALVIVFGAFMSGLDGSVVSVALNSMSHDLDADLGTVQWVANGYLLALAVSLPGCAWTSRRFGAGRVWLAALAGFTVTSGLCAAAGSVEMLIVLRVLQGLSAGLLIPAGQTVLGQAVGPHRLGRVMATLGIAVTLAPVIGPAVGGLVLHVAAWPWLFLINLPIGAVGLVLGWRYVPRDVTTTAARLDVVGLLLVSAGLPLLVYGVTAAAEQQTLLTATVWAPMLAGVALLAGFVVHVHRSAVPVLNLRLLRKPAYAAAVTASALIGASLFGSGVLLALYFQLGRGYDVLSTGLLLIPTGIGTAALLPWAGRLIDRHGGGPVAVVGGAALLATTVPFALMPLDAPEWAVQALLVLRGMATALTAVPATVVAYAAVTADELPDATTQVNIVQRIGGALGGALLAVLVAAQLPHGPATAFAAAFWALSAATAAGLAAAAWMATASRRHRPTDHTGSARSDVTTTASTD